jgi:hypothetical protein
MSKIKFGGTFSKLPGSGTAKVTKVAYTNPKEKNIEQDSLDELTELQKQFKENAKKERELKAQNTNSEFWSCLIFKTQEQRNQFMELLGLSQDDYQYVDGQKLIKALGLKIEEIKLRNPGKFKCNAGILELAMK